MEPNNLRHPCYNKALAHKISRIHLPIASRCNLQCNYCNKKFDCPNENRPGVSSTLLSVNKVPEYLENKLALYPHTEIIGVAGPAEALANFDILEKTFLYIRNRYPKMKLCLATNGIDLPERITNLKNIDVDFITITINALNLNIIEKIYKWVEYNQKIHYGMDSATIIKNQQQQAIELLDTHNIKYKVNTVVMPGINDNEIINISKFIGSKNAAIHNIIPLIPVKESLFSDLKSLDQSEIDQIRKEASNYINIIDHCKRCRADAAGNLSCTAE